MDGEALRSRLVRKLEILSEGDLETVVRFVDALINRATRKPQAASRPDLSDESPDSQLEWVDGILVLKLADEPADPNSLDNAVQDMRNERLNRLMAW
jgi:hypothetical protein